MLFGWHISSLNGSNSRYATWWGQDGDITTSFNNTLVASPSTSNPTLDISPLITNSILETLVNILFEISDIPNPSPHWVVDLKFETQMNV